MLLKFLTRLHFSIEVKIFTFFNVESLLKIGVGPFLAPLGPNFFKISKCWDTRLFLLWARGPTLSSTILYCGVVGGGGGAKIFEFFFENRPDFTN